MRISVLSDIHGNAVALEAAVQAVNAFAPDQLVILGDLLTYGPSVERVLDCVESLAQRQSTRWVMGNHEELYFDLNRGVTEYFESLPDWLRETIGWTFERLDMNRFASFPWERECEIHSVLFSHANPWHSWRYLQNDADYIEASETIRQRGIAGGVFGHTHRSRMYCNGIRIDDANTNMERQLFIDSSQTAVVNAGSVGQPRDDRAISTILAIDLASERIDFTLTPLKYNIQTHLAEIQAMELSSMSTERLTSFFAPSG